MFSSAQWSPGVRLCGDDEDDERIFGILPVLSVCCIFILVCEAHYENIIYAVPSSSIPVLDCVFVCFIHLQSPELMSLNLTSWMSTFSVTFSAVLSSQCYGYQNWLLSVQAGECYIECDVLPTPGWCAMRWDSETVRQCDTQCGSWCNMTSPRTSLLSPRSSHLTQARPGQVFQTVKLRFNNLEGNWLWGGSQVWDHDITDIVVQRSPRTFTVFSQPRQLPTNVMESSRWLGCSARIWR